MSDPSLCIASEGEPFIIGIYVNDILLAGKSDRRMAEVRKALAMQFEVKNIVELHHFLGVKIIQSQSTGEVGMGQAMYAETLCKNLAWKTLNQSTHQ